MRVTLMGCIRNWINFLFHRKESNWEWTKVRPGDLGGPHPRRLKPLRFIFRLDGADELAVDMPLPPYQHDYDLPPLDMFSRRVLGQWDRPDDERVLVVDDALVEERVLKLQNNRIHWQIDHPPGGWTRTEEERLALLQTIRSITTANLITAELFFHTGPKRLPSRFAEFRLNIAVLQGHGYLSAQTHRDRVAAEDNDRDEWCYNVLPLRFDPEVLALNGAFAQRFRTRALGDDEVRAWSADRTSSMNAQERHLIVIPMSATRALSIGVVLSCESEAPRRWRDQGVQTIEAMLSGMRFTGPWPRLTD